MTVFARDGLLPLAEPSAAERVRKSLKEAGERAEADELLVAIGRTPDTQDIGPDQTGLRAGGWLAADDTLRAAGQRAGYARSSVRLNGRAPRPA